VAETVRGFKEIQFTIFLDRAKKKPSLVMQGSAIVRSLRSGKMHYRRSSISRIDHGNGQMRFFGGGTKRKFGRGYFPFITGLQPGDPASKA
jgi:hypothetical protein